MSHATMHEIVVLKNETCSIYCLIIQQSQRTCEAFFIYFMVPFTGGTVFHSKFEEETFQVTVSSSLSVMSRVSAGSCLVLIVL